MANVNQEQIQLIPAQNQLLVGSRGPLAARLILDFSQSNVYDLDMQLVQAQNQFDLCQSIFVDNRTGATILITFGVSGHKIQAKANTQGWYNVIAPNPIVVRFEVVGGGGDVTTIFLTNVAIPGSVWPTV